MARVILNGLLSVDAKDVPLSTLGVVALPSMSSNTVTCLRFLADVCASIIRQYASDSNKQTKVDGIESC